MTIEVEVRSFITKEKYEELLEFAAQFENYKKNWKTLTAE